MSTEIRRITPTDSEWPDQLHALAAPPRELYVRGRNLAEIAGMDGDSVAIVGARNSTHYGEKVARDFATYLAALGWSIVSGGAFGIDYHAHRGALLIDGITIAVLAGGLDAPYPRSHDGLFREILERGALISEQPPGVRAAKGHFLNRNRIIAGLSRGTIVVEAAFKSGAIRTARDCAEIFRPVLAIPGAINAPQSAGTNTLIRDRIAELVTSPLEAREIIMREFSNE
ncbi:MAG: DNA-protecting protein DprA [Actinobacteria bacterium]|nr:DNA-protecting protein DprA [Actinomycetota bacterium]